MVVESKIIEVEDMMNDSDSVVVTIRFNNHIIQFPINPEMLKNEINSESLSENVEGIGEISIPQSPSLSTMSFSSFFPHTNDESKAPSRYVEWIKNWQSSKKPANLIVSGLGWKGWDMLVTCESFSYWTSAGEEGDIYFDIAFKEYRPYKAQKIKLLNNQFVLDEDGMTRVLGNYDYSLYYEVNSGIRDREDTLEVPDEVTTGEDESIGSLCQKYNPFSPNSSVTVGEMRLPAKDFYENNKEEIAESLAKQMETLGYSTDFLDSQMNLNIYNNKIVEDGRNIVYILSGVPIPINNAPIEHYDPYRPYF